MKVKDFIAANTAEKAVIEANLRECESKLAQSQAQLAEAQESINSLTAVPDFTCILHQVDLWLFLVFS